MTQNPGYDQRRGADPAYDQAAYDQQAYDQQGYDQYGRQGYEQQGYGQQPACLLYTSPSPRDRTRSRMPSSA